MGRVINRRVRVGQTFYFAPVLIDRIDAGPRCVEGELVRVVNMHGCPKANTMGHCYVELIADANGKPYDPVCKSALRNEWVQPFGGLVHTNSLLTQDEYIEHLKMRMAEALVKATEATYSEKL